MTIAYDIELLRVALDRTIAAANAMLAHDLPDWMCHRLTHIIGECHSLKCVLDDYGIETKGETNEKSNSYNRIQC